MTLSSRLKKINQHSFGSPSLNNIVEGDSKVVLGAIQGVLRESVKCIYIDPPYNNGEKYTHYNDSTTHEIWMSEMIVYLSQLRPLLQSEGSLWISIDEGEMHYLKVLADQVFGRQNFIATIIWQQRSSRENRKVFSNNHEYILVYAKDKNRFSKSRNLLPITPEVFQRYKNPDNDSRGPWQSTSANVQAGHAVKSQFYEIVSPTGIRHAPPKGRCWVYNEKRMKAEIKANNIWFGAKGDGVPRIKKFFHNSKVGLTPETLWFGKEVGTTDDAKKQLMLLFPDEPVFDTPKPEHLIRRILDIATNEGDLVLDAFLGSGTTAAVAHKMNRAYLGIENGEHIVNYAVARLEKVISGESGGISREVQWQGGGGFNFYRF